MHKYILIIMTTTNKITLDDKDRSVVWKRLCDLLKLENTTVSVIDACTSGLLHSRFTEFYGDSYNFFGGISYDSRESVKKMIGLDEKDNVTSLASKKIAEELCKACLKLFLSDVCVSATECSRYDEHSLRVFICIIRVLEKTEFVEKCFVASFMAIYDEAISKVSMKDFIVDAIAEKLIHVLSL